MNLHTIDVLQAIRQTRQPFTLVELAAAGEMALRGYICLGAVNWHKHTDYDEAFLILDGMMALESEWGNVLLRAGEAAVAPKGILHRSGSQLRTHVLLIHTRGKPERKNGQRRILGSPGAGQLVKFPLYTMAERADLFLLEPIVNVDEYTLQLVTCDGLSPGYVNHSSDVAWLALQGQAQVTVGQETVQVNQDELVVVPRGATCQWLSSASVTLLWIGLLESPLAY